MEDRKVITSFTKHDTAEGVRLSYTYSIIGSDGSLKKSNVRENCIVLDESVLQKLKDVNDFILARETV